jgi:NitT/TauT family transport system ATP-binding protein
MKTCAARSRFVGFAHVLFGKPVATFPGHALMPKAALTLETAAAMPGAECATADIHLALRGVSHTYPARAAQGPVPALGSLDLEFRRGEFVGVVGPSGCGKSTLLEIIAGLVTPTSGTIEMEGRDITGTVADEIGVVFQEDATFAWLNVWDNVAFGLRRAGTDGAKIARRVDGVLAFMGLTGFRGAYPAQLSGGMRQRVCIARTLVMQPRMILLDEPFGALDQQTRLLMGDELLRLWRETGATVLLITHALDEATMLADRVGVMSARPGRFLEIIPTGWPRERDSTIVANESFGRMTSRLWKLLRGESLRAMGHG